MPKRNFIQPYMLEPIKYGGVTRTRADVLKEMKAEGHDAKCIDYFVNRPAVHETSHKEIK